MALHLILLAACSGSPADTGDTAGGTTDTDSTATGPGTLALSFEMDADYFEQMDEPAVGTFRGSVFAEADASAAGPVEGAEALFDISVSDIDLSDGGGPTGVLYTSEPFDPQIVWVLGCLDTDGNDCDYHDPITIPNENKVLVEPGVETTFNVYFGMINPQE